jgi:hypothetical protein
VRQRTDPDIIATLVGEIDGSRFFRAEDRQANKQTTDEIHQRLHSTERRETFKRLVERIQDQPSLGLKVKEKNWSMNLAL